MTLPGQVQINEQGQCTIGADGRPHVTPSGGGCCCGTTPGCWYVANLCPCPNPNPAFPLQAALNCASVPVGTGHFYTFWVTDGIGGTGCYRVDVTQTPLPDPGALSVVFVSGDVPDCSNVICCPPVAPAPCPMPFQLGQCPSSVLMTISNINATYTTCQFCTFGPPFGTCTPHPFPASISLPLIRQAGTSNYDSGMVTVGVTHAHDGRCLRICDTFGGWFGITNGVYTQARATIQCTGDGIWIGTVDVGVAAFETTGLQNSYPYRLQSQKTNLGTCGVLGAFAQMGIGVCGSNPFSGTWSMVTS